MIIKLLMIGIGFVVAGVGQSQSNKPNTPPATRLKPENHENHSQPMGQPPQPKAPLPPATAKQTPPKLPAWSNSAELKFSNNFKNRDDGYGFAITGDYEGTFKYHERGDLAAEMALTRDFHEKREFKNSDLYLKANGVFFDLANWGSKLTGRFQVTVPVSEDSHDQSLRTSLQFRLNFNQKWNWFFIGYRPRFIWNSHRYETRFSNNKGNINYLFLHRIYLGASVGDWELRGDYEVSRASDYEGYTSDKFSFSNYLKYKITPVFATRIQVDNAGSVFEEGSQEYNFAVYNRETSVLSLNFTADF